MKYWRWLFIGCLICSSAHAQRPMRPPAFAGGIPGMSQMQAIFLQRHQVRTALYREALEELRKNPQAADVPECSGDMSNSGVLCLKTAPAITATPPSPEPVAQPKLVETKPATATVAKAESLAQSAPVAAPVITPTPQPKLTEPKAETSLQPSSQPLVTALPTAMPAQTAPPAKAEPPVQTAPSIAPPRRIAILIGNNAYSKPIPALETPIADVESIAQVLRSRLGFEPRIVRNASKPQIIEAINEVAATARPEDSVLLFYAGHGYLMEDIRMGFWIPLDASVKTSANWISNNDISKLLKAIQARQLILVSDSCFSGSLTKEQKMNSGIGDREEVLRRRSVLAFSSGDEEPVSDEGKEGHSIFAYNLIKALESINGMTPGYEIYQVVHGKVRKEYEQTPQYGAVVSAGHATGGEFLFEVKR